MLSGFLSMQFEIQNFLSVNQYGGRLIDSNAFEDISSLSHPDEYAHRVAEAVARSLITSSSTYEEIMNATLSVPKRREQIFVPLYHRAFPTHHYEQSVFWHTFGAIMTIALAIYFSIPAAIIGGAYRKEMSGGHLEVISTFPLLRQYHSAIAWCISGSVWVMTSALVAYGFFVMTLSHSYSLIPCVGLLLFGMTLCPISIIIGLVLTNAQEIALATPTIVFVTLLPGMLYVDLAFDIQRHIWIEILMSLLPSSCIALLLRHVFDYEALGVAITWSYPAPISSTPTYIYILMLLFDNLLYGLLALSLVYYFEPIKNKQYVMQETSTQQTLWARTFQRIAIWSDKTVSYLLATWAAWRIYLTTYVSIHQSNELHRLITPNHSYDSLVELANITPGRRSRAYSEIHQMIASINSSKFPVHLHDEDVLQESVAMTVDDIVKLFYPNNRPIEILSQVSTKLFFGSVYSLLGSNGAGKTTFLRILCGLDSDFSGSITVHDNQMHGDDRAKVIGWCPQGDPLFPEMTVDEHLTFFGELLDVACAGEESHHSSWCRADYKAHLLQELDMESFRFKYCLELSGGMRRRLSLLLAFIGNPMILLLDEPTTGCDSWNRELIRKAILSRKASSSILVSTHHIDDMEILSDHVLFLNERHLVYDGSYRDLFRVHSPSSPSFGSAVDLDSIIFSTSDSTVKEIFHSQLSSRALLVGPGFKWAIQSALRNELYEFLHDLETRGLSNWAISAPNLYNCLEQMYQKSLKYRHQSRPSSRGSSFSFPSTKRRLCKRRSRDSWLYSFRRFHKSCKAVMVMRWREITSHLLIHLVEGLLIPCVIVLIVSFGCRDVRYPKIELKDSLIDGLGEIVIGYGGKSKFFDYGSIADATPIARSSSSIHDFFVRFHEYTFVWLGKISSNKLWKDLFKQYYQHRNDRWCGFIVEDVIPDWIETSVTLNEVDFPTELHVNMTKAFEEIDRAKQHICNTSDIIYKTPSDHTISSICGSQLPSISIELANYSEALSAYDNHINISNFPSKQLTIRAYQSLVSNLTMLSNVTAHHASPIFLKEVVPLVYASLMPEASSQLPINNLIPAYQLFSHPLPVSNLSNEVYIERGYVGSVLILFYLLINCIKSVRMIAQLRESKVKSMLHMKGLPCLHYWMSMALCDSLLCMASFLSIGLGIAIGGNPVRSYFFDFPPAPGILFLLTCLAFSTAIVSSSYFCCVLSRDSLSSQLLILISIICNGIFMKLYFDRHREPPWPIISESLKIVSPAYSISTCFFEMFRWHALKASVQYAGGSARAHLVDSYSIVMRCLQIMFFQSIFYLVLTILIDSYSVKASKLISVCYRCTSLYLGSLCLLNPFRATSLYEEDSNDMQSHRKLDINPKEGAGVMRHLRSSSSVISLFPLVPKDQSADDGRATNDSHSSSTSSSFVELESRLSMMTNESSDEAVCADYCLKPTSILRTRPSSSSSSSSFDQLEVISVNKIYVQYAQTASNQYALRDLSISIARGEKVALMGSSGCGKSSLFKAIAFAENIPIAGSIIIDDRDLISEAWKIGDDQSIGYVPQEKGVLDYLTVRDLLKLLYNIHSASTANNRAADDDDGGFLGFLSRIIYEQGFLPEKYLNYPIYALSGGNKKKVMLMMAQIGCPPILLMDEVTSGVDPLAADQIINYLRRQSLSTGKQAMLFASHRIDECNSLCDRILIIDKGQVFFDGPIQSFEKLSYSFYQVDLFTSTSEQQESSIRIIDSFCSSHQASYDRLLRYSAQLMRITFERSLMTLTVLWRYLESLQQQRHIDRYAFHEMSMEEVLSSVIARIKSTTAET
jgi:ABC-type multidrug transport system ATPase subunit